MGELYNEEEVKELFDVVFKLSAKDIDDKLKKVYNRPEIAKRRWFWELLQNAKDSVKPNEKVSVKLLISSEGGKPFVEFIHNGNPFRYQDAKNLIFPYSDKADEEYSDKSGRFGTGFLATHILSKQIKVKGVYLKDGAAFNFHFTLDRSGTDKPQISESINKTWQEFRNESTIALNYSYNQNNFETSFRYDLEPETLEFISNSLKEVELSLPFALTFIPKIEVIEIDNRTSGLKLKYQKHDEIPLLEHIKQYVIKRTETYNSEENTGLNKIIVSSDEVIDLAIEIFDQGEKSCVKEMALHQPTVFCPFPLIGATDFKFPVVVNCTQFIPKEERDGIWLDSQGYGSENQIIFERVKIPYLNMISYASSQNWKQTYLLLKSLKEEFQISDFNSKWFKDKIQDPLKTLAITVPLVDIQNGKRVRVTEIYFQNEPDIDNRRYLWHFMKAFYKDAIPALDEINSWYEVLWRDCPNYSFSTYSKYVSSLGSVDAIHEKLGSTREKVILWLNKLVEVVGKVDPNLLNDAESRILPNQIGNFKRKDELYLDDGTIEEELKKHSR
jgi:hypothetical protein